MVKVQAGVGWQATAAAKSGEGEALGGAISVPLQSITVLCVAILLLSMPAQAQVVALDPGMSIEEKRSGWIPYLFSTDSLGTAVGAAAFSSGNFQPQSSLFGTGFVTSNDSALVSGALSNVRFGNSRWFFDGFVLLNHFTDQRFYVDVDEDPAKARAGSNDSDPDDFATGTSDELTLNLTMKYRLPIGGIEDDPVAVYRLREGLLESGPAGGRTWNPMTGGQTTFAGRFFYTYRDLDDFTVGAEGEDVVEEELVAETNGLEVWLEYNNTDFPRNPSRGSRQLIKLNRDFGWFDSSNSWTNIEFDASKYFDLGRSKFFRQRVIALDFWTSNTTTWESSPDNPNVISNRPPPGYGSELGGFDRLRAYPTGRFRDKAAVYYAAELRVIPQTQPLRDLPVLKYFEIDWWQLAPFAELGRVGPEYNSDLFFEDLKWSAGIGLRLMAFRQPVRLDFATSDEGSSAWAMFGQPFSRQGN
jgi:outer membrane protein assembly factor BamA